MVGRSQHLPGGAGCAGHSSMQGAVQMICIVGGKRY